MARKQVAACRDCGGTDLFSAFIDQDGDAHTTDGPGIEWRTVCNDCGGEWNGKGE